MSKDSQPPTSPPSNEPIVREVKPASRSKRPPLFDDFLANFKGGTALEQALAEQAQREQAINLAAEASLTTDSSLPQATEPSASGNQSTGQPVDQSQTKPRKRPTSKPVDRSTSKTITKTNLPTDQSTGRPNNQATLSINESQSTGLPVDLTTSSDLNAIAQPKTAAEISLSTSLPAHQKTSLPVNLLNEASTASVFSTHQVTDKPVDRSTNSTDATDQIANEQINSPGDQETGQPVDQSLDLLTTNQREVTELWQNNAEVPPSAARQGSLRIKLAPREAAAKVSEPAESQPLPDNTYPSRIGKVKIGVWLPEQQVEMMKLWYLMHKTPMQEIIQQAVADWWEKQSPELAVPVENVLKTLPTVSLAQQKKRDK